MRKHEVTVYSDATGNVIDGPVTQIKVVKGNARNAFVVDLDGSVLDEELGKLTLAEVFAKNNKVKLDGKSEGPSRTQASTETTAARKFAKENGIKVGDRGMVHSDIVAGYASVEADPSTKDEVVASLQEQFND